MNSRIKNQIKKSMEKQVIEIEHQCSICSKTTKHNLNFKSDSSTFKQCNTPSPINDDTYESIYKELKKFGVQF